MSGQQLLYLESQVVFLFGALSFSVLTLFYWRSWRRRSAGTVFPLFTVVCAAAFLLNLILRAGAAQPWAVGLAMAQQLATGLVPPLLLHLVYEDERAALPAAKWWKRMLAAFYAAAAGLALMNGLADAGVPLIAWAGRLDRFPAVALAVAAAGGLILQFLGKSTELARYRRRIRVLLALMLYYSILNMVEPGPFSSVMPDYLLLAFFCVTLYYKERLVFFDLLIKRGAFFAIGLAAYMLINPAGRGAWIVLAALWLGGPWIYDCLGRFIDTVFLKRRFAPPQAERKFVDEVQGAGTVEELRRRAEKSLESIFQTKAEVKPDARVILSPRKDGIPFMSDDVRLLESLERTLAVVQENVRIRQQREELRLLAGRAELTALRAQINPHFLFNALNAIAGLIHERPELADETIEQLAQVFRYTLRKSGKEWVRLEEEVEFVTAYLRVEQARFGDRLRVEFDVDPAAGAVSIPAMTIQPLIENAIKHGVSAVQGCGIVRLRAAAENGTLIIEVFDNGPGFAAGFAMENCPEGHGLRNVVQRLRGYYGAAAELRWESAEAGCRVLLRAPCPVGEQRCAS